MQTVPEFPIANYATLKELVQQGEGLHLEFKRKAKFPEKILKEISAFANTGGGLLLIGVDDNLTIPGVESADEEEFMILNGIGKYLKPALEVKVQHLRLPSDNYVVVFQVPKGEERPYMVQPNEYIDEPRAYIRMDHQSIQASREMRELLKVEKKAKNLRFEYGEKEKALLDYLTNNPQINVTSFAALAKIPKRVASRTLVLLTACNVLNLIPSDGIAEDWFVRK